MTTLDVLKSLAERDVSEFPVHLILVRRALDVMTSIDEPANKLVRLARVFRGLTDRECELALDILCNWPTKG